MAKKKEKEKNSRNKDKNKINWYFVLGILALLAAAYYFYSMPALPEKEAVLASVNEKAITQSDLDRHYKRLPEALKTQITEEEMLEQLIVNELLLQEASKQGITANKEEVMADIGKIRSQFTTEEEFKAALKTEDATLEELMKNLEDQYRIMKLLNDTILSKIDVSEAEIGNFFEQNRERLTINQTNITQELLHDSIYNALLINKQKLAIDTYISQLKGNAIIKRGAEALEDAETADMATEKETVGEAAEIEKSSSFSSTGDDICSIGNKPAIRLFSSTKCSSCQWIKPAFSEAVEEFKDRIIAYHWEMDIGDNLLTEEAEKGLPMEEVELYKKYNPGSTLPTFVFGCRYVRIGNAYEEAQDLKSEALEFKGIINKLIS